MSSHPTDFKGDVVAAIRSAIEQAVPSSRAHVAGGGGHYSIEVTSDVFAGKSMLEAQRIVYRAIAHLMAGEAPPVHAVDSLTTHVPV
jgi:acid stress-induced BolA-like protein IbaG/YrbA